MCRAPALHDPGDDRAMPSPPVLTGARVVVSLVAEADAEPLCAFHGRNFDRLKPWMPPVPEDFLTLAYWQRWAAAGRQLYTQEQAVRLIVRRADASDRAVIGQVNFSNIVRGPFQGCFVGYHVDAWHEGQGFMRESLELAIRFMFDVLGLHRIMAGFVPSNDRSRVLLRRLGFVEEGYAKDYLFIDDAWRDHVLTAIVNPNAPDPRSQPSRRAAPAKGARRSPSLRPV